MSPQQYLFTVYIAVGLCFNHLRKHRSNWLSFAFTICPLCTCLSILCLVNKACTVTVCVFVYVRSWVWVISLCCARNPIAALNDNLMRGKKRKRYLQIWAEGWWKPLPTRLDAPVSCPSLVLLGLSLSLSFFPSLHPATSCGNTIAQHLCPLTDTTSHASLIIHEACCDWLCAGGARTGFQVGSVFFFFLSLSPPSSFVPYFKSSFITDSTVHLVHVSLRDGFSFMARGFSSLSFCFAVAVINLQMMKFHFVVYLIWLSKLWMVLF